MKKYKLLKDLPTFKDGETFHIDNRGNLAADDTQGRKELIAYTAATLRKFPNILSDWFKEIKEEKTCENPDKVKKMQRRYRQRNKERIREYRRHYIETIIVDTMPSTESSSQNISVGLMLRKMRKR